MKYFVIADVQCVELFRAIGVEGLVASCEADAKTAVTQALLRSDIGTLLVSKSVQKAASDEICVHQASGLFPAVVTLDRP